MYRMFIKEQKGELIEAVGNQGGGFIPAEIMVCQNFELAEPDPEARKYWHEIVWKEEAGLITARLLEACKAQHQAIDKLFAMLIQRDSSFFPSKSGQPWEAIIQGNKAIELAEK